MLKHFIKTMSFGLLLMLGGCSASVDFSKFSAGYDHAMQKSAEKNLLLNIVRSSQGHPLHFTTVSSVTGSSDLFFGGGGINHSIDQIFSWSRPELGAFGLINSPTFTQTSSVGVNPLTSAEFLSGLLTQIDPKTITFFAAQGIPKELLLHLTIESVEVFYNGENTILSNDPTSSDYAKFKDLLLTLIELGITTETINSLSPLGPELSAEEAANPAMIQAAETNGLIVQEIENTNPVKYQLFGPLSYSRFCFSPSNRESAKMPTSALCSSEGSVLNLGNGEIKTGNSGKGAFKNASIKIVTRSARGLFDYLGKLVYLQNKQSQQIKITLETMNAYAYNYLNEGNELFVVKKDASVGDELLSVNYLGSKYSIPKKDQGFSATVLSLALDILNLSKSVNSLPPSTTVRLQ